MPSLGPCTCRDVEAQQPAATQGQWKVADPELPWSLPGRCGLPQLPLAAEGHEGACKGLAELLTRWPDALGQEDSSVFGLLHLPRVLVGEGDGQ